MSKSIAALKRNLRGKSFTMDGEKLDVDDFIESNYGDSDLTRWLTIMAALKRGESFMLGGGAAASFDIKRTR